MDESETSLPPSESDDSDEGAMPRAKSESMKHNTVNRFSVAQTTCLNSYFMSGMTGTGKDYSSRITRAASC